LHEIKHAYYPGGPTCRYAKILKHFPIVRSSLLKRKKQQPKNSEKTSKLTFVNKNFKKFTNVYYNYAYDFIVIRVH